MDFFFEILNFGIMTLINIIPELEFNFDFCLNKDSRKNSKDEPDQIDKLGPPAAELPGLPEVSSSVALASADEV